MNMKKLQADLCTTASAIAQRVLRLAHDTDSSDQTAALCIIAAEILQLRGTFSDTLRQISSEIHALRDDFEEYTEERDAAADRIGINLTAIDRTLYDTLASYKTGAALDAIAKIPEVLEAAEERKTVDE